MIHKKTMRTFILVHGAWHAAWCWEGIAKKLRTYGHHVITPDLPGHGSKICAANNIRFTDYVTSIIKLIKAQPTPVTLVGHSMAGLIISQVAEIIPEHLRELVFVAAYIGANQESLLSIAKSAESTNLSPYLIIDKSRHAIHLKSSPELAKIFFNCCHPKDIQYALARLQSQPLQPFTERLHLGTVYTQMPKRSLISLHDRALLFSDQLRMSKAVTDHIIQLNADHAAYYSGASEIINALLC